MSAFASAPRADGASMILLAVLLIALPGVLYNNLNNTGLVNTSGAQICSADPSQPICQLSASVACQANPAYCTLTGQTISFLNAQSPFTQLLQGNIFGAFTLITSNGAVTSHGPFDWAGSNNFYTGNCIVQDNNKSSIGLTQYGFLSCTASNPDGSNMTLAQTQQTGGGGRLLTNWNTNYYGSSVQVPFYQLTYKTTGSVSSLQCNWQMQINYTFNSAAYEGWTWYGCDYANLNAFSGSFPSLAGLKTYNVTSFLVAVPWAQGNLVTAKSHVCPWSYYASTGHVQCYYLPASIQFENWDSYSCFTTTSGATRQQYPFVVSPQCDSWYANFKQQTQNSGGTAGANFGLFTPFVTFFLGIIFFFLGLGINFAFGGSILGSGTTVGGGVNRQGTKLMQVLGLGLVIFSFVYAEFSVWYTSGLLPIGLDGATGIISILLGGLFWFGVYLWATME
jgi:hypothetical protein